VNKEGCGCLILLIIGALILLNQAVKSSSSWLGLVIVVVIVAIALGSKK
jgi:hypothetical protein